MISGHNWLKSASKHIKKIAYDCKKVKSLHATNKWKPNYRFVFDIIISHPLHFIDQLTDNLLVLNKANKNLQLKIPTVKIKISSLGFSTSYCNFQEYNTVIECLRISFEQLLC